MESEDHVVWEMVKNILEENNPEEIWMTHYFAKELSINRVTEIAERMWIIVRVNRPYEEPFYKNKINGRRGLFECLLQEYNKDNISHIFTSSGCPYSCGFCLSDKKVQYRGIGDIIYEMDYLVSNFSCDLFTFWDDAFTLSKKRIKQFMEAKAKSLSSNVKYKCESRADSLNEEIVLMLKESGCDNISVGFETGSPRLLELIKKGEGLEDYYRAADLLHKHSMNWNAYAMVGFPTEMEEEVSLTFNLIDRTQPDSVTASAYTPYPGTYLSEKFGSRGKDIFRMCHQSENVNITSMDDSVYEKTVIDFFKRCDDYNKD